MKKANTWRLNSLLPNNQEVTEEVKKESLKIPRNKWQWKYDDPKPVGCSKSSDKKEVYSTTSLPQETRKTSSNLTLHLKQLEKEQQQPKNQSLVEGKKS